MRTCTATDYGVGTTTGSGIKGAELSVARMRQTRSGRWVMQRHGLHGRLVASHQEADSLFLLHGLTREYSRNLTGFVMSRAARRRGMTTTDWVYMLGVKNGRAA